MRAFTWFGSGKLVSLALLLGLVLSGTGCSTTAVKSDFLTQQQPLHKGKHLDNYWSSADLAKTNLAKIYLEPIDTSRIKDVPEISRDTAAHTLKFAALENIRFPGGWKAVDEPGDATAKLSLAITHLEPGSMMSRAWAAEFGAGHAYVQVDGKLVDMASGKEVACFMERRRDSGSIGFEDLGGNAAARMVKRMLERIAADAVKEISESAK